MNKYKFECPQKYAKIKGKRVSGCQCWSSEYIATYYDCITRHGGNIERSLKGMVDACNTQAIARDLTAQEIVDVYNNGSSYFIPVADIKNASLPVYNPIKFTKAQIDLSVHSWAAGFYVTYTGQLYGGIMAAYFGLVVLLGAIFNITKKLMPGFVHRTTNNKLCLLFRKKIANPALFGFRHSTPVKLGPFNIINVSLPTRAQSYVLAGYYAMFIIFMFIKIDLFDGNTRYATKGLQLSRYLADRSGIIAITQVPLIYLFAGRNNIMLWVTGWSYDTFNVYHRAISRVMYICVFIHGTCFSANYGLNGTLGKNYSIGYFRWGMVACIAGGLIIFQTIRHFRESVYETFLQIHRVLVIVFTFAVYYHLKSFGYLQWFWAAIAVWAFDRAARLVRILVGGVRSKAEMQVHGHEFVKFKVNYSGLWKPQPGAYAFIYFLKPFFKSWEDHPFSCYPSPVPGEENKIVFCMRILNGKTKQMANYLADKPEGRDTVPVLIEGPYGQHFPVENSDSIVLICGGIGFTGAYSYACHYKNLAGSKRISFIWITRFNHNLSVFAEELDFLAHEDNVDVQLYVTDDVGPDSNEKTDTSSNNNSLEKRSVGSITSSNVNYGIPNLSELIPRHIEESSGSTAFMVCGPPGLNDSVRKTVVDNMDKGKGRVDIYVEAFNW